MVYRLPCLQPSIVFLDIPSKLANSYWLIAVFCLVSAMEVNFTLVVLLFYLVNILSTKVLRRLPSFSSVQIPAS